MDVAVTGSPVITMEGESLSFTVTWTANFIFLPGQAPGCSPNYSVTESSDVPLTQSGNTLTGSQVQILCPPVGEYCTTAQATLSPQLQIQSSSGASSLTGMLTWNFDQTWVYPPGVPGTDFVASWSASGPITLNGAPSLLGQWTGTLDDSFPGNHTIENLTLTSPDGTSVSGTFQWLASQGNWAGCGVGNYPCVSSPKTGVITGGGTGINIVGLEGYVYTATLSPDGSTLTGQFTGPGDSGTWTVTRGTTQPLIDQLSISNPGGKPVAGWISGDLCCGPPRSPGYQSRLDFVPTAPTDGSISLKANYTADASNPNEVVAFTLGQLPQYVSLPQPPTMPTWTLQSDTINVDFAPPVTLPIQFWDASGSPSAAQTVAQINAAFASGFYFGQRTGITVLPFPYAGVLSLVGAPINPMPGGAPPMSLVGCQDLTPPGKLSSFHRPNELNVYVTDFIADENGNPDPTTVGLSCGGAILLSTQANDEVLAHEIGHELVLAHTNQWICPSSSDATQCNYGPPLAGFDSLDLMDATSPVASYLTSGQVFRTTFDYRSLLNGGGGVRDVPPTEPVALPNNFVPPLRSNSLPGFSCDPISSSPAPCPMACKDLWGAGVHGGANACPEK